MVPVVDGCFDRRALEAHLPITDRFQCFFDGRSPILDMELREFPQGHDSQIYEFDSLFSSGIPLSPLMEVVETLNNR